MIVDDTTPRAWLAALMGTPPNRSAAVHRADGYLFFRARAPRNSGAPPLPTGFVCVSQPSGWSVDLSQESYHNIINQFAGEHTPPDITPVPGWEETAMLINSILAARRIPVPDPDVSILRAALRVLAMPGGETPAKYEALARRMRIGMARALREGDTGGVVAAAALVRRRMARPLSSGSAGYIIL